MYKKVENKKGSHAWQWKGGKPKCLDCGGTTTQYTSKRCLPCYRKTMKGENSPAYKGASKNSNCIVCNTVFSTFDSVDSKFCSQKCYGTYRSDNYFGEKIYNWIQDRTSLKDDHKDRGGQLHRDWSKNVKNRDGWKCKIANDNCSGRLEAHHILGWSDYPELRYELNNGITLCHAHHPRKRKDEAELSPYFQKLVAEMKHFVR